MTSSARTVRSFELTAYEAYLCVMALAYFAQMKNVTERESEATADIANMLCETYVDCRPFIDATKLTMERRPDAKLV